MMKQVVLFLVHEQRTQPKAHKETGDKPFAVGEKVLITEYVFAGKEGRIVSRIDSDDPDSYNYFVYEVAAFGGKHYLTEHQVVRVGA